MKKIFAVLLLCMAMFFISRVTYANEESDEKIRRSAIFDGFAIANDIYSANLRLLQIILKPANRESYCNESRKLADEARTKAIENRIYNAVEEMFIIFEKDYKKECILKKK